MVEFNRHVWPDREVLPELARQFGVSMSQARFVDLDEEGIWQREEIKKADKDPDYNLDPYTFWGLYVDIANGEEPQAVEIHFGPDDNVDERVVRNATRYMLLGLTGLQNYCFLVEAGYIQRPALFESKTNVTLARLITRLGFTVGTETDSWDLYPVSADYFTIREHTLSEWADTATHMLFRRMSKSTNNMDQYYTKQLEPYFANTD